MNRRNLVIALVSLGSLAALAGVRYARVHDPCTVACDLAVFTPEERRAHVEATKALLARAASASEVSDGFVLHLRGGADTAALTRAWAKDEARCCPFYRFRIDEGASEVTLAITGPAEAKEILRAPLTDAGLLPS